MRRPRSSRSFSSNTWRSSKHAKDKTDAKMKDYLFAVIEGLGVPEHAAEQNFIDRERGAPVIHRRSNDG